MKPFFLPNELRYSRVSVNIVILKYLTNRESSGIIGLYTAYLLLERGIEPSTIKIIAKHVPGDMSHDYASPYAGAGVACVKNSDPDVVFFSRFTFENLERLQKKLGGPKCGLDRMYDNEFWEEKPSDDTLKAFKSYCHDCEEVPVSECPEGSFGIRYKTWMFHAPKFIDNLSKYLKEEGIAVEVRELKHINEAYKDNKTIVFNCTGLGSKNLAGVNDSDVIPVRAQAVVIRAPYIKESGAYVKKDSTTYVIKRPGKGDEVILGGFYQPEVYNIDILGSETEDILRRVEKYFPYAIPEGYGIEELDILRVISAFRPGRRSGPRIEKELLEGNKVLVHNYGARGVGYAQGLGMAETALRLAFDDGEVYK